MRLRHHVSENLIVNQGCSQKYNNNENIHVDNTKKISTGSFASNWDKKYKLEVLLVNGI